MRFSKDMAHEAEDPAIRAFAQRGLDIEVASRMGASYLPRDGKFQFQYAGFRKFRNLKKDFWIEPTNQKLSLWNFESLRELPSPVDGPLVITEGEFDAIAVMQACGGYVVSVPNGVAGKRTEGEVLIRDDNRFAYLWQDEKLIPELERFDKIILATDNDGPGLILRDELALRLGETRCWYVTYPEGCKDANDVLARFGETHEDGVLKLREVIDGAKPLRPGYLVRPDDIPARSNGVAVTTGWSFMDPLLKIERPELLVVTGIPNHGKGQFIRCLAFNLAAAHGWKTAFLTPEDPAHRVRRDMVRFSQREFCIGRTGDNIAYTDDFGPEEKQKCADWYNEHFRLSLPPEDEPITIDMVEREMESAALHHDCQVFVLDPWNEVDHDIRNETETQYIERTLRRLLRKMRRLNLLLIIAAHPTKLNGDNEPELYNISGSAHWKNKCQHGLVIFKPKVDSNAVKVTVEKSKDWETMGKPGQIDLVFKRSFCDYKELPVGVAK